MIEQEARPKPQRFYIYANTTIRGIKKRFYGGSGTADIYVPKTQEEYDALSNCAVAQEIVDEEPQVTEAEGAYLDKSRQIHEVALRKRLQAMKWRDLIQGPGSGIYKVGLNRTDLEDAIINQPGTQAYLDQEREKLERQASERAEAERLADREKRAAAANPSARVVVGPVTADENSHDPQ